MSEQDELTAVLRDVVSAYFEKDDGYGSHLDAACVAARALLERLKSIPANAVPQKGFEE